MADFDENGLEEIEISLTSNDDMTEYTIVFKASKKINCEQLCVELESLAHDLSKADNEAKAPGVKLH